MRTYKVTRGPHYDAATAVAVPELTRNSFYIYFLRKLSLITCKSFLAAFHVRINQV